MFSLVVCMRERQHIYEDLNESSSASPGGSQQLEIPPSLNSKQAANFFQIRWFFTWRWDFNVRQDSIVRLYFCETPTFQIRLFFCEAPIFSKSAYFSVRRQYFSNPPIFLWGANISWIRLILWKAQGICEFAWFLLLQIFVYIFRIYYAFKYVPIFLAQLF